MSREPASRHEKQVPLKNRNWFQFHFSSALVTMVAAAILLKQNLTKLSPGGVFGEEGYSLGWPYHYYDCDLLAEVVGRTDIRWQYAMLVLDLLAAFIILCVVIATCEFAIRGRWLRSIQAPYVQWKRQFRKTHLLTMLLLFFLSVCLLRLNLTERFVVYGEFLETRYVKGWPLVYTSRELDIEQPVDRHLIEHTDLGPYLQRRQRPLLGTRPEWVVADGLIAVFLILTSGAVSEYIIHCLRPPFFGVNSREQ